MAISTELETLLTATPDLLKAVQDLDTKAAKADALEPVVTQLKTDLLAVNVVKNDLLEQRTKWKTDKENTVSKADFNKTVEDKTTLEERLKALETSFTSKEKEAADAKLDSLTKDLRSSIISVASTGKAINPQQVFLLMQGEGLIGMKDGKPFFNKLNDKKEATTSTPEEATKWYLENNKHLVSASGNIGTGNNHTGVGEIADKPMTREQARKELLGAYSKK